MRTQHANSGERGFVLVISLVMLVILTLLVVSAIRSGNSNLRVAGNMQVKEEGIAAAQQATEQVISVNFTAAPVAQTINIDVNKDGTNDYVVNVQKPACTATKPLLNADLDATKPADQPCLGSGTAQNTGLMTAGAPVATGTSWCNQQKWDVEARVNDATTGVALTAHQGISMRTPAGTECD